MTTLNIEQGSEAWHHAKLGMIGGTRFATAMSGKGTEGYKGLIMELAVEIITRSKESSFKSFAMERGIELEPEARAFYEQEFGVTVKEVGLCYPDDELLAKWVAISPDGLVYGGGGGTEFKCPLAKTHMGYIQKRVLPNVYKWQCQGYLFITGAAWWDFMSYHPDLKPFIIRVLPDIEMHKALHDRLLEVIDEVSRVIESYESYEYIS